MYLVTIARPGFVQFATTPHGRAAVALDETGLVRLLAPGEGGDWRTLREWSTRSFAHTDLVVLLGDIAEPERAEDLLPLLPPETLA